LKPQFSFNEFIQSLPTVWKWGKRVGFSILDQGLFSGANFALNILLARWLTPEEYGAFAVAFVIFLFIAGISTAFFIDPMAVFGALKPASIRSSYLKTLISMQFIFDLGISLIFILIGILLNNEIKTPMTGMAISTPFLLALWLIRQSFYIQSESHKAFVISGIYSFTLIIALIGLEILKLLNIQMIFVLLVFSTLIPSIVGIKLLDLKNNSKVNKFMAGQIIKENWDYGKWVALTATLHGVTTLSFVPIIGTLINLNDAAAYKGVQNLINPMSQILVAIGLFLVPNLSKFNKTEGIRKNKFFRWTFPITLIPTLLYISLIMGFSDKLLYFFYKQDFYQNYRWLIVPFSIYLLVTAIMLNFSMFLRINGKTKVAFIAKIISFLALMLTLPFLFLRPTLYNLMIAFVIVILLEAIPQAYFIAGVGLKNDSKPTPLSH